jgi:hypothetical protein
MFRRIHTHFGLGDKTSKCDGRIGSSGSRRGIGHANSLPLQSGLSISTASSFGAVRGFVMCLTPEKK